MRRPIFITTRAQPIPRWREAFPDALVLCDQPESALDPASLSDAAVVWLHLAEPGPNVARRIEALRARIGATPLVALSNVPDDDQGLAVLSAGASGYCSALTLPEILQQVAAVVEQGGLWVGPQLMRRLMQSLAARNTKAPEPALDTLSLRERQVAEAVARGSTNKEIARVLGITERTVKAHLTAAFEKLGVRDRMQLSLLVNGVEESTSVA